MESGQHRISIKLLESSKDSLFHMFGVVRDGRAWDANCPQSESTDVRYMTSGYGGLYGNGKERSDNAGDIYEGQIISMVADLDKGTLRFWLDGRLTGLVGAAG